MSTNFLVEGAWVTARLGVGVGAWVRGGPNPRYGFLCYLRWLSSLAMGEEGAGGAGDWG
jgi:hypothetical protein